MAEILDKFPLRSDALYPWDEWMDGRVWRLARGSDFDVSSKNFAQAAHITAKRRGVKLRTHVEKGDQFVVIQVIGKIAPGTAGEQERNTQ